LLIFGEKVHQILDIKNIDLKKKKTLILQWCTKSKTKTWFRRSSAKHYFEFLLDSIQILLGGNIEGLFKRKSAQL
jgi:hypothetical protein